MVNTKFTRPVNEMPMSTPHLKGYARLRAGDELVVHGVVVELGPHEDITGGRGRRAVRGHDLEGHRAARLSQQLLQRLDRLGVNSIEFQQTVQRGFQQCLVLQSVLCSVETLLSSLLKFN